MNSFCAVDEKWFEQGAVFVVRCFLVHFFNEKAEKIVCLITIEFKFLNFS